jgi:hypothetical protein
MLAHFVERVYRANLDPGTVKSIEFAMIIMMVAVAAVGAVSKPDTHSTHAVHQAQAMAQPAAVQLVSAK